MQRSLDILNRAGVEVLWRDNNSSSKGVANRVTYQDFKTSGNNPICDVECRDVGMQGCWVVYKATSARIKIKIF